MRQLRQYQNKEIGLERAQTQHGGGTGPKNLAVYQVNAVTPFELDVVFESDSVPGNRGIRNLRQSHFLTEASRFCFAEELSGEAYSDALARAVGSFDEKFETIFQLKKKGMLAFLLVFVCV